MAINKVLSIEIGFATTRIVEVDYLKKNPKVYNCVIFDTPEGMLEDGFIRDKSQMAQLINSEIAKAKIETKDIVFTIYSNKIISREVFIPQVKESMIASMVKGEAAEYFPMDISDHVVTYTLLDKIAETKQYKLIVFAAPEILVNNYYELAEEIGGTIVSVDYTGNSVYQLLKRTALEPTSFVLQINAASSLITIMENSVLTLQRTINYGTNTLADVVLDNPFYEAATRKTALSVLCKENLIKPTFDTDILSPLMQQKAQGIPVADSLVANAEGKEEITEAARPFINNIRRVMEYYMTKSSGSNIGKIYLTGTGINIKGLAELISNETGTAVEIVKSTETVSFRGAISQYEEHGYELIPVLGASYAPLGFVPSNVKEIAQKRDTFNLFIIIGAAAIVVAIIIVLVMYLRMWRAEVRHSELETDVANRMYIEDTYNEYLKMVNAYNELVAMHAATFTYNEYLNDVISELEKCLPSETIIHSLVSQEDKLTLNITVPSKEAAAQLLLQLTDVKYFSLIETSAIAEQEDEVTSKKEVSFSVICTYTVPIEVEQPAEEEE